MTKHANACSRFIEGPSETSAVLEWFRAQALTAEEGSFDGGIALHFTSLGKIEHKPDGAVDTEHSPVAVIYLPTVRRGIFWTVGEAHFLPIPLNQFPELASLRQSFLRWFDEFPLIYEHHPEGAHEFDYYLEGSAMNWGPIRAFPSGLAAIKAERYFVSCRETESTLSTVCKKLRLRGVNCSDDH